MDDLLEFGVFFVFELLFDFLGAGSEHGLVIEFTTVPVLLCDFRVVFFEPAEHFFFFIEQFIN
jgi:hypothetical protein